ncbi:MAG: thrombospondin type 3 repeat-containing protein [Planctomycetota bacterium]|nr:thrombospondin type 3 repeat-containing protein [Planctomycetota bacterium]
MSSFFRPGRRVPAAALGAILCSFGLAGLASAQFTAGNVVVLQQGDGTSTLANTGNALTLREFTPAGAPGFSVAIPSTGSIPLIQSGSATSEGNISRSSDGSRIIIPGYAQSLPNATNLSAATAATINRAVGAVDTSGAFTRPFTSSTFYSANNFRGATSDGTNYWGSGAVDGVDYFGPGSPVNVSNTITNIRAIAVQNGQLYYSTGSGSTRGVYAVGVGTPTTTGTVSTSVVNAGASASPYQFAFNAAGTVCYVADDRTIALGGGIQKWTGSGTTWTLAYTLGTGSLSTVGARGLVVDFSGTTPVVFAVTTEGTANRVIRITDTGSGAAATTLLTAGTNFIFRGLAASPVNPCTTPAISGAGQPVAAVACTGGSASFTVTATGSPTLTYQWKLGSTPLTNGGNIAGAQSATLTINPVTAGDFGTYTVTVTNSCGNTTSNGVTLSSDPTDTDGDGTANCTDGCPLDPLKTAPGICGCGTADTDSDLDGTPDCNDGCPLDPLKLAPGACGCGVADTDTDLDGTPNCTDGCPTDPLKTAPGLCGCGVADTDSDLDGTPDCNDGCPLDPLKLAPGACGCGVADTDSDLDGTPNCTDGCPADPLKIAHGVCGCGVADTDSDLDGTPDCNDGCPTDPLKVAPGACGCGTPDTDSDLDGTPNCADGCPTDPLKIAPGICGCGVADTDSDLDGTADCNDGCPADPLKTTPGQCGCGIADTDSDQDGTANCNDGCPSDPLKVAPGQCGCGVAEIDTDGDTVSDCIDNCDTVANLNQADVDSDGVGNACDNCVALANPGQGDCDGNSIGDVCDIAGGAPDCNLNGVLDSCDIAGATSQDLNGNAIPDECETNGGTPFCFGYTGCPCGNDAVNGSGEGCRNSTGVGARLVGSGLTSLSADGLLLSVVQLAAPPSGASFCLFFQGSAQTNVPFLDGRRCAGGAVVRLATKSHTGASTYPQPGDQSVHTRGLVAAPGVRAYQVWYRNPSGPCGQGSNLSNGLSVIWVP